MAIAGTWFFRRRAPAVALGLVGAVIGGFIGHHATAGDQVPAAVAEGALVWIFGLGLFGLVITPNATRTHLVRAAGFALVGGAIAVRITWTLMLVYTCDAYDPPTRRWCGGIDLFYGTSGIVTMAVGAGAVIIVLLFLLSALRAPGSRSDHEVRPGIPLI